MYHPSGRHQMLRLVEHERFHTTTQALFSPVDVQHVETMIVIYLAVEGSEALIDLQTSLTNVNLPA